MYPRIDSLLLLFSAIQSKNNFVLELLQNYS